MGTGAIGCSMSGAAMCGRRDQARVNPNPARGKFSDDGREDAFWRDTSTPIVLGANVVGLIAQDKQNVMGVRCYMEALHVLRRTTACLLRVCRLARRERGCAQFSPQENKGKRSPRTLIVYAPARVTRPYGRRWWLMAHSVLTVGCHQRPMTDRLKRRKDNQLGNLTGLPMGLPTPGSQHHL